MPWNFQAYPNHFAPSKLYHYACGLCFCWGSLQLVPVVATIAGERQYCIACVCQVRAGMVALLRAQHGYTPLHLAVDNNHVELAKLLLDKGGHPDAADTVRVYLCAVSCQCVAVCRRQNSSTTRVNPAGACVCICADAFVNPLTLSTHTCLSQLCLAGPLTTSAHSTAALH
jgi:Ankyrin repeat